MVTVPAGVVWYSHHGLALPPRAPTPGLRPTPEGESGTDSLWSRSDALRPRPSRPGPDRWSGCLYDPSGNLVFGSRQDISFIFPYETPMPGGGRAVVDHTAAVGGRYTVEVASGIGEYQADLEVYETGW